MKKKLLHTLFAAMAFAAAIPAHASSGGPDAYGYTWTDSNDPNGPLYNWIEIATPAGGSGTYRSAINCDDCHEAGIPIGFNFPFYGVTSNTLSISSNGTVYFENIYLGLSNTCMPGTPSYTMTQYKFIAHMWDDLAPNYQGGIYTQTFPNYMVIEYYDIVPCCSAGDGDTWEVILFRNGNILMQYKELSNQGLQSDFTVGIQNDPATGLQYKCDATGIALASGRAILFSPPTFSCGTVSQNILGANTGFCPSSNVVLNAGNTSIAQTWSTGAFTSTISVNAAGSYSIFALDTNGCTIRDTVAVSTYAQPSVNLGADATVCGSAVLDAGAGLTYLWNDNSTAQTLTATASGTYSVVVTDPATTCTNSDAINITVNPLPTIALGADITQCGGMVTLDAGNPGMMHLWSDNSTNQTLMVMNNGTYMVAVLDPMTGCANSDTINVTINAVPTVALGADITQCGGMVTLDAGNAGMNYLWNDNSTNQTLMAMMSGTYSVTVTDPVTGCSGNDAIDVTINPVPAVVLGADVTQCGGSVTLDAGNPGMDYLWSDGATTQTTAASATGTYSVTVTDPVTGCSGNDAIDVTINANPTVALGTDMVQCGGPVTLDAGNQGMNYLWSDNSTSQTLSVSASGTYYVTVTDANTTCSGSDTINVTINANPAVTFTLGVSNVCVDDASFALSGGAPAGGMYSGPGVSGTTFDPSSGTGAHVITYTYTDANGCSGSAVQTVMVNPCTGVEELSANEIRLFPNPTSGILNIETGASSMTVEVFNAIGEVVFYQQVNAGTAKVDLSGKDNGVYFVKISTANGNVLRKVVLQR